MLTQWGRDRSRGEQLPTELLVKWHAGMKADINVIDFEALRVRRPEMAYDFPAGGERLVQRADGYRATVVSGEIAFVDGEATGALPGRVVRSR